MHLQNFILTGPQLSIKFMGLCRFDVTVWFCTQAPCQISTLQTVDFLLSMMMMIIFSFQQLLQLIMDQLLVKMQNM